MVAGKCDLESRLEEVWHLGSSFKKKKTWKWTAENDSSQFTAVPSNSVPAKYSSWLHMCTSPASVVILFQRRLCHHWRWSLFIYSAQKLWQNKEWRIDDFIPESFDASIAEINWKITTVKVDDQCCSSMTQITFFCNASPFRLSPVVLADWLFLWKCEAQHFQSSVK